MAKRLIWLESKNTYGSASLRFENDGVRIYLDPSFLVITDQPPADIILITHDHNDHLDPVQIGRIIKPDTIIVGPASCHPDLWPERYRIPGLDYRTVAPGDELVLDDFSLTVFPAYNPGDKSVAHPRSAGGVGYLMTFPDGIRIYFSGDTSFVPELAGVGSCDIAVVNWSTTCMMGPEDVLACSERFHPEILIPIHWLPYERKDLEAFKKRLPQGVEFLIPEWGG